MTEKVLAFGGGALRVMADLLNKLANRIDPRRSVFDPLPGESEDQHIERLRKLLYDD
ncbi:MAG: hypothetical protein HQL37_06960 [Alphaproteobacteria bacterium]|nr:hypothetical protein [Alphaproteobacteria bacterium]